MRVSTDAVLQSFNVYSFSMLPVFTFRVLYIAERCNHRRARGVDVHVAVWSECDKLGKLLLSLGLGYSVAKDVII